MENEVNTNENISEDIAVVSDATGIKISEDVVSVIAGVAASEVKGVCGMSGGLGITEVLSGKKNMSKGIKAEVTEKDTKIDDLINQIDNKLDELNNKE